MAHSGFLCLRVGSLITRNGDLGTCRERMRRSINGDEKQAVCVFGGRVQCAGLDGSLRNRCQGWVASCREIGLRKVKTGSLDWRAWRFPFREESRFRNTT